MLLGGKLSQAKLLFVQSLCQIPCLVMSLVDFTPLTFINTLKTR